MDAHLTAKSVDPAVIADAEHASTVAALPASGLRFYGDEFVFDTKSGMFFRLSAVASFILRSIVGGVSIADLPAAMQQRYGIDHAMAARDVQLFLNELVALDPLDQFVHDKANPH
ncbi:hypothetical protein GCM10010909_02300 [Acidocella aquatica]|uniref:PqqD family protein n=1 Tax=Acidocella aquatica TaxID=1922313 RepID=A0ABQ6A1N4_9PROT|nr:PqqD family protein [Acidocella aquatica]GLR65552.1 hypothetical protein GCM10010909_02300 [Acidocella aquatica]